MFEKKRKNDLALKKIKPYKKKQKVLQRVTLISLLKTGPYMNENILLTLNYHELLTLVWRGFCILVHTICKTLTITQDLRHRLSNSSILRIFSKTIS